MKWLILVVLITGFQDINKIARINKLKKEAEKAYTQGQYERAIRHYKLLVDSLDVSEDRVLLNLANAYYRNGQNKEAIPYYTQLFSSDDGLIRSAALQQMGVLAYQDQKISESIDYFKEALKADPSNEGARYNYELVRKASKESEQENQNDQNDQQEPSEYARRLKAQADQLVAQGSYEQAYNLMQNGLKTDPTVSYYQSFITRTAEIAEIDEKY